MSRIKDFESRFHLKKLIAASGVVAPESGSYPRRGETWLRLVVEGAGAANSIQVQGKLIDQVAWQNVGSPVVGNGSGATIDVKDYDEFRFNETTHQASATVFEVQKIAFDAVPDAGVYKIAYGGVETSALAFNALAAAVQAALRLIPGLEQVTVAGDYTATGLSITFVNVLGDLALVTIEDSTLEASALPVVTTVTQTTAGVQGGNVTLIASGFYN